MAGLRERNALQPTVSPPRQDYNQNSPYPPHQPAPQQTYQPTTGSRQERNSYIPPSGSAIDGDTSYTALPNMPAYSSQDYPTTYQAPPAATSPSEPSSEKRGFRKLVKRRPLPVG